jgi:nudix-type nucleoside diphosphatase (YffH/AdpP family)
LTAKIVKIETLHKGWSRFSRATLEVGGKTFKREIEDHGRAVGVLPYNPQRRTAILVRLLRAPALFAAGATSLLEAPAGLIDADEPAAAARREVEEEAGVRIGELEHVATTWTMPGISTERMDLYLAAFAEADRVGPGGGVAGENEDIVVEEWPLKRLWSMIERAELDDMKTLTLMLALRHRHPKLFEDEL